MWLDVPRRCWCGSGCRSSYLTCCDACVQPLGRLQDCLAPRLLWCRHRLLPASWCPAQHQQRQQQLWWTGVPTDGLTQLDTGQPLQPHLILFVFSWPLKRGHLLLCCSCTEQLLRCLVHTDGGGYKQCWMDAIHDCRARAALIHSLLLVSKMHAPLDTRCGPEQYDIYRVQSSSQTPPCSALRVRPCCAML